jgi:hypothetical protein
MGGISSVSGGVLWMGILPSDDDGKAKNAGRDNNVLGFHSRIPNTVLPLFLGHAMTWFHANNIAEAHRQGFITFFWIGGSLGIVSFLMFILSVHPRFEELDVQPVCGTRCQCTRKWFLQEQDLAMRARLKREGKDTFMIDRLYPGLITDPQPEPEFRTVRVRSEPVSQAPVFGGGGGPGAVCCDWLLFGSDRYERAQAAGGSRVFSVNQQGKVG